MQKFVVKSIILGFVLIIFLTISLSACNSYGEEPKQPTEYADICFTFVDKNGAPVTRDLIGGFDVYEIAYEVSPDTDGKAIIRLYECDVDFRFVENEKLYEVKLTITKGIMEKGEVTVVFEDYERESQ